MAGFVPWRHPAAFERRDHQERAARALLRNRTGYPVREVFAIEVDRIAFVNHMGEALTALLSENVGGRIVIDRIVKGWPIEGDGLPTFDEMIPAA